MGWFAVRSVYLFGSKPDGANVFEERVVCFEASSPREALEKAEAEARTYAEANGFERFPRMVSYEQDGEALIDGYELWSELFEAREGLASFWESRYARYEYRPER